MNSIILSLRHAIKYNNAYNTAIDNLNREVRQRVNWSPTIRVVNRKHDGICVAAIVSDTVKYMPIFDFIKLEKFGKVSFEDFEKNSSPVVGE